MLHTSCVICASNDAVPVYRLRRDPYLHRLGLDHLLVAKVMCRVCGLVYSQPQLEPSELKRLYDLLRPTETPSPEHLWWKRQQAREDFEWVAPHLALAGAVLEIGCSEGSLLREFRDRGWTVCGVEPSAFAEFGRREYGLDILQGSFEDMELPAQAFDVVVALRVLEHVSDPRAVLARGRSLLKRDGRLYLEVPDAWKPRHHPAEFWGAHHLRLFTHDSLAGLLHAAGFSPLVIDESWCGLRALAAPAGQEGTLPRASSSPNHVPARARALRRALLRYQVTYFCKVTARRRARQALDWILGPRAARALVAWGKRTLGALTAFMTVKG